MAISDLWIFLFSIIWSFVCFVCMQKEMLQGKGKNRTFKALLKPFSRKRMIYLIVMITGNLILAGILTCLYTENTVIFNLKRIGLMALVWGIAPVDYKANRIPNTFILLGAGFRILLLVFEILFAGDTIRIVLLSEVIAAAVIFVLVMVCMLLVKNSIGMGDLKLLMLMGICQGIMGMMGSVFFSMVVSFIAAVYLLLTKKKSRKDVIPFAPCILIGLYLSVFLTGA